MGTWNTKIDGNDTFLDIYQNFFALYNQGLDPVNISRQIQEDFKESFEDHDDKNNSLFGLALAQWETKSPDPIIYEQVKRIIESREDLEVWRELGANEKILMRRQAVLEKFLTKISTTKNKPKRRVSPKHEFSYKELINIPAPDNKKTFSVKELFTDGVYIQTGSFLNWQQGGGSVIYFNGQGKFVSARWLDNQTLEITYDKTILFDRKEETFYFCGDQGKIIYIEKEI